MTENIIKKKGLNWAKKDISGQRFNKWVVLSEVKERSKSGLVYWTCKCDCGLIKNVSGSSLRTGRANACFSCSMKKHDLSFHPLYMVWSGIKTRCFYKKSHEYHIYGGRGITMSDEWKISFQTFYNDMINGYKNGLEIDRIDNNGNYCKENCRWATKSENLRNKRDNIYLNIDGVSKTIIDWAKDLNINPSTIYARKHRGWEDKDCISFKNLKNYGTH